MSGGGEGGERGRKVRFSVAIIPPTTRGRKAPQARQKKSPRPRPRPRPAYTGLALVGC